MLEGVEIKYGEASTSTLNVKNSKTDGTRESQKLSDSTLRNLKLSPLTTK